jgi:RHS repeat-associated protein
VRSVRQMLRAVRIGLSAVLVASVVPLMPLGNGVASAAGGPSVPTTPVASVPVTTPSMQSRPIDEATDNAASGNQNPDAPAAPPGGGTHAATSLSPSATWNVSGHTGDFSWSYPLRVPPAPGGFEPGLSLSYSSSAVDGRTSATNNQASWVGDGWDLSAGFVERTYGACAQDTMGGTTPPKTGDLCWRSDNATSSFPGGAGMLVGDDTNGWRTKNDNGAKVERLTGAANGDDNGEHWRITTVDGTQYLFGSQPAAKSTWTVPVFGDDVNEPCHAESGFADSHCVQAYRWNLDKVIDRHGNVIRYTYDVETNNYGMNLADTAVSYTRSGTLRRVEYGLRDDLPNQPATGQVEFTTANRCVKDSTCTFEKPENWPDTPLKERCVTSTCVDKYAPTFWSTQRLSTITARVWNGTKHADVSRWTLGQEFPDPGDGAKAALWLRTITHTGLAGTEISLPAVTFEGAPMANRVHKADGAGWLNRYRVTGIVSESGGLTSINYADPQCKEGGPMPANPESNTLRCFPARWVKENWAERTDYFHKYVVASVVQSDRLSTSTAHVTTYEYLDGAGWHWDTSEFVPQDKKTWNEFRGFGRVRVRTGSPDDPAGPVSMVEQRFYRGMDGDKLPNNGTRPPVNVTDSIGGSYRDHDWLTGFGFETTTFNGVGGAVVSRTITEPSWQGPTATRGEFKAYIVRTGVQRGYTALAGDAWRTTRTETDFDDRGLATKVNDLGDTTTAVDDRCTRTTYIRNESRWLLSFPAESSTVSVRCGETAELPAQALGASRISYDGHAAGTAPTIGNATRIEVADTWTAAGPAYSVIGTSTYDRHGRSLTATDAAGKLTTTAYTPTVGGPLTQTTVTSPATLALPDGMVTTTTVEPAFGQVTMIVDPNMWVTEIVYDAFGRKTRMWLPDLPREDEPGGSVQFEYGIHNDKPSVVTTRSIPADGEGAYVVTHELFDGLLRKRQMQAEAVGGVGRLLTDIRYDSQGRVFKQTQPYFNDAPVDTTLRVASDVDIPGLTRTEFDGANRVVAQVYQHGGVDKWSTTTAYDGDRVHVTPPPGGTATTAISDARGQTIELRQYTAAGTPTGAYDTTRYSHTPAGQLATVTDPDENVWRFGYDLRGRKISAEDPDRGTTTSTYDNADRLSSVTDARDVTVAYAYDALGRRTAAHEGSLSGPKRAEWLYDTALYGYGRLASSTRWTNGHPYTTTIDGYSPFYQPSKVTTSIPAVEGKLAGNYVWYGGFNMDGSLSGESYPAAGGLTGETVNYVVDDRGLLQTSSGAYNGTVELVTGTDYTRYGEVERLTLGEGLRSWQSFYYEDDTRRLKRTVVDAEVPNPMQADLHYTYDPAGNLTSIADIPTGLAQDRQCFRYDRLRRLTEAWTPTSDCQADPASPGLGGAAPYWHSYGYDTTGNRVSETQHATADPATADLTRTYAYTGHRLDTVTTPGIGGDRVDEYGYDPTGNTTSRVLAGQDETLNWDLEGHLTSVNKNGQTTSFVYDADGRRLLRRDPTGATLFLGKQEVEWIKSTNTTRTTRYYTHGGDGPAIATRQGATLSWLASDHHGTGQITINATTMQVNRRRHLPFGAPRGDQPSLWPGQQGFLGGTQDPSTGLTHLGAREYDPTLGRFISVDPIMNLADPQQMHGYTYSNNNPTTYSDPTGLAFCDYNICPGDPGYHGDGADPVRDKNGNCVHACQNIGDPSQVHPNGTVSVDNRDGTGVINGVPVRKIKNIHDFASKADYLLPRWREVSLVNDDFLSREDTTVLLQSACESFSGEGLCDQEVLGELVSLHSRYMLAADPALALGGVGGGGYSRRAGPRLSSGVRACGNSFAGGTGILMADRSVKPIKDIKVGDRVWATDPETGESGARTVAAVWKHQDTVLDLVTEDGATITTTEDHPYWNATDSQWQQAQHLDPGDRLLAADGGSTGVGGLRLPSAHIAAAYNLTVTGIPTYYVLTGTTSVLVHNCEPIRIKSEVLSNGAVRTQQAPGGSYRMSSAEKKFVGDLLKLKPNFQVFRTDGQRSMGDFLVIDRSNPKSPVGWVVELKTTRGGFPGEQFKNAWTLKGNYELTKMRQIAGTPGEVLAQLNLGRGSW